MVSQTAFFKGADQKTKVRLSQRFYDWKKACSNADPPRPIDRAAWYKDKVQLYEELDPQNGPSVEQRTSAVLDEPWYDAHERHHNTKATAQQPPSGGANSTMGVVAATGATEPGAGGSRPPPSAHATDYSMELEEVDIRSRDNEVSPPHSLGIATAAMPAQQQMQLTRSVTVTGESCDHKFVTYNKDGTVASFETSGEKKWSAHEQIIVHLEQEVQKQKLEILQLQDGSEEDRLRDEVSKLRQGAVQFYQPLCKVGELGASAMPGGSSGGEVAPSPIIPTAQLQMHGQHIRTGTGESCDRRRVTYHENGNIASEETINEKKWASTDARMTSLRQQVNGLLSIKCQLLRDSKVPDLRVQVGEMEEKALLLYKPLHNAESHFGADWSAFIGSKSGVSNKDDERINQLLRNPVQFGLEPHEVPALADILSHRQVNADLGWYKDTFVEQTEERRHEILFKCTLRHPKSGQLKEFELPNATVGGPLGTVMLLHGHIVTLREFERKQPNERDAEYHVRMLAVATTMEEPEVSYFNVRRGAKQEFINMYNRPNNKSKVAKDCRDEAWRGHAECIFLKYLNDLLQKVRSKAPRLP